MDNPLEMTYPQLKKYAAENGLDASGKKDELLERIQNHMISDITESKEEQTMNTISEAKDLYQEEVNRELPSHIKDDIKEERRTSGYKDIERARQITKECNDIFAGRAQAVYVEGSTKIDFKGGARQMETAILGQPRNSILAHAKRYVGRVNQRDVGQIEAGARGANAQDVLNNLTVDQIAQLKALLR